MGHKATPAILSFLEEFAEEGSEEFDIIADKIRELRFLFPPTIITSPDPNAPQFNITIPGEVVGKQSIVVIFGRGPNARPSIGQSPKSKKALKRYREAVKIEAMVQRWEPLDCPVDVHIRAFIDIKVSYSARKTQALLSGPCTDFPDPDNIAKMVLDALVGAKIKGKARTYEQVVIRDDKLSTDLHITKRWCEIGQERLEITVTPVYWNAKLI